MISKNVLRLFSCNEYDNNIITSARRLCNHPDPGICDNLLRDITNSKGIKIASLNINSLLKHIDEIRVLLTEYTFDILTINESKIDNSISDNELHIFGYDIIRKDRNRYGGGVVLYVRDNIPFSERKDLIPKDLEMVCILKLIGHTTNHF